MFCTVLVSSKAPGIGNGLTYACGRHVLDVGMLVRVPLRTGTAEGIVLDVLQQRPPEQTYELRDVHEILSAQPLLTRGQVQTLKWMASHYCCSLRQAARAFLPAAPWNALLPSPVSEMRLIGKPKPRAGSVQRAVCEHLRDGGWHSLHAVREETGLTAAGVRSLVSQDIIELRMRMAEPKTVATILPGRTAHLTPQQQEVLDAISSTHKPSLLFGVTGSGKTEVYAASIAATVATGKQCLLLVPEILLSEHHWQRFEDLLPGRVQIVHSRLTPGQRKLAWRRIRSGDVALVIGSRSALFAPLHRLGLVIVDEEHEWTYKNEQTPRYHARDTAEALCAGIGAKLLLGSATPSLESWARAKQGRYHLARLAQRYGGAALPSVRIVDLADVSFGTLYPFSPPLLEAIGSRLSTHEQSVLFLNRRGVATGLLCLRCRQRLMSQDTGLPLTLHRSGNGRPILVDHASGAVSEVPAHCPHCTSTELRAIGAGTQGIEELLAKAFPSARVLRADADTLASPQHMRTLLSRMRNNDADILLGTQSVVKGLDLPNVTLAAVLLADVGLSLPTFRAGERVFQLLTQLTGRSGRARPGEVIIQTFRPQAPEIALAAMHDTEAYMDAELRLRERHRYPPATQLIRLIFSGDAAKQRAQATHADLAARSTPDDLIATVAPTLYGGGRVWHVLLRGKNPRAAVRHVDLRDAIIDIDPVDCL